MKISRPELLRRSELDLRYLIYGKELFMVERCCEEVRKRAVAKDYSQRLSMTASPDFQWQSLNDEIGQLDIFGSRKLIELRLPESGRAGVQGSKVLSQCAEAPDDDTIIVVIGGALDASVRKTGWFKAWTDKAVVVDNPEMHSDEICDWVKRSLDSKKLAYEPEVPRRLAYYFEGNVLACANELRKLTLADDGSILTVGEIDRIVADQGRFNVFSLIESCLDGNAGRALRQLRSLKNEGTEPIFIQVVIATEIRTIYRLAFASAKGKPLRPIFEQMRIWKSRQSRLEQAARRLGLEGSVAAMQHLAKVDRVLKGRDTTTAGSGWDELERFVLRICNVKIGYG